MAKSLEKKVFRLKSDASGLLETRGLAFMDWSNYEEETFLSLWIIYYK